MASIFRFAWGMEHAAASQSQIVEQVLSKLLAAAKAALGAQLKSTILFHRKGGPPLGGELRLMRRDPEKGYVPCGNENSPTPDQPQDWVGVKLLALKG